MACSRYRNPRVKPAWYKARQRSITPAQKAAERTLWPLFGLVFSYNQPLDIDAAFGRVSAPTALEIGCGAGEALVEYAAARPDVNFIGVDWYRSGLASCLQEIERRDLQNVRLCRADALMLLEVGLPAMPLLDEVLVFFPDPWRGSPERRIMRPDVMKQLSRRMRPSGQLRFASDVPGYPEDVQELLASHEAAGGQWRHVPSDERWRPSTKYAREAAVAGRAVQDLCFEFISSAGESGE